MELWKKIYAIFAIGLIFTALVLWLVPSPLFSPDTELGRDYFVLSNQFDPHARNSLITRAQTRVRVVALTFDDGPDPRFTPDILSILETNHIKATFFVVGEDAALNPDLVLRAVKDGHEIENHTYTHPDLLKNTDLTANEEIAWNHQIVEEITGRAPIYFRPPRKLFDNDILTISEIYGYKTVLWTICLESRYAKTPEEMSQRVVKYTLPGSIILLHDGHLDRSKSIKALPILIRSLKKKGYRFVTLEELLNVYDKPMQHNSIAVHR